jgi:hypothetical protein
VLADRLRRRAGAAGISRWQYNGSWRVVATHRACLDVGYESEAVPSVQQIGCPGL